MQLEQNYDHPNVISLKELSRFCSGRLFETENDTERLLCFFLSNFIDDFFCNLSTDTPYDEKLQDSRISFYKYLSKTLVELCDAIKTNNQVALFECLAKSVSNYIEKINFLNGFD